MFHFSSRIYLPARESPHALHSFRRPPHPLALLLKQFQCLSGCIDDGPFASSRGRSSSTSSVFCSPPGDRLCDVLGFCDGRYCLKLLNIYDLPRRKPFVMGACFAYQFSTLDSSMSRAIHPQESSKMDVEH